VAGLASAQVDGIEYPNFKAKVDRLGDPAYASALHEAWHVIFIALAGDPKKR
jgi:hypothetical protein